MKAMDSYVSQMLRERTRKAFCECQVIGCGGTEQRIYFRKIGRAESHCHGRKN